MEQIVGLCLETLVLGIACAMLLTGIWELAGLIFGFDLMTATQLIGMFVLCPIAVGCALTYDWVLEYFASRKR